MGNRSSVSNELNLVKKVAFIYNKQSGQERGSKFAKLFVKCGCEVFCLQDLNSESKKQLQQCSLDGLPIIVGGGDGTTSWAISIFDELNISTPIALFPLGSGNNLAKCIGWSNQEIPVKEAYVREYISAVLANFESDRVVALDRWDVKCDQNIPESFLNYLSFGSEGKIAYHAERCCRGKPCGMFCGHMYAGIVPLLCSCCVPSVELTLNGKPRDNKHSLVVSNITSYAGKLDVNLWGDDAWLNDGELEIVSHNICELIAMALRCKSKSRRIGKSREVIIEVAKPTYIQIDGEGFKVDTGVIEIMRNARGVKMILGPHHCKGIA